MICFGGLWLKGDVAYCEKTPGILIAKGCIGLWLNPGMNVKYHWWKIILEIGYQISLAGPKFKPNNKSETTLELSYEEVCHAV